MDERRARRRRRNWVVLMIVAIGVPILAYVGLMLAIAIGLSGSY